MYLDLDELPGVLDPYPLFSARRAGARPLPPRRLHGRPGRPLAECARDAVEAETGSRPAGPVRLLANLRYLGHVFNPVASTTASTRPGNGSRRSSPTSTTSLGESAILMSWRADGAEGPVLTRRARQGPPRLAR